MFPCQNQRRTVSRPTHNIDESDRDLWSRFKAGKPQALDQIYTDHFSAMYSYGLKIHQDHELVTDAIQELFAELWQRREHLGEAPSIKFYLLKSIKRKIIKKANQLSAMTSIEGLGEQYNFKVEYSIEENIISQDLSRQQSAKLHKALESLSDRQREIIYLRFYQGFSFDEISEIMSVKSQSARNLLFEGVSRLKAILLTWAFLVVCHPRIQN